MRDAYRRCDNFRIIVIPTSTLLAFAEVYCKRFMMSMRRFQASPKVALDGIWWACFIPALILMTEVFPARLAFFRLLTDKQLDSVALLRHYTPFGR